MKLRVLADFFRITFLMIHRRIEGFGEAALLERGAGASWPLQKTIISDYADLMSSKK